MYTLKIIRENNILIKIFGPTKDGGTILRIKYNRKIRNLFGAAGRVPEAKSGRLRWADRVIRQKKDVIIK